MSKTKTKEQQPTLLDLKPVDTRTDHKPPATAEPKAKKGAKATAVAVRQPTPPSAPPPMSLVAQLAQLAADPKADADKTRAYLDMLKECRAEEARMAFTRDFIALQGDLPIINRDGKIEIRAKDAKGERTGPIQQATLFATYPNIMRICKPLLKAHRFGFSNSIEPSGDGKINVVGLLEHEEGHSRVSRFPLPAETSGSKNNVQGWGASQQYGMRYNAIALLNIVSQAPQDADRDGFSAEAVGDAPALVTETQVDKIRDLIEAVGCKTADFISFMHKRHSQKHGPIEKVEDIPASLFDEAVRQLRSYERNQRR